MSSVDVVDYNMGNKELKIESGVNEYILVKNKDLITRSEVDIGNIFSNNIDADIIILSSRDECCKNLKHSSKSEGYDFFESLSPGLIEAFAFKREKLGEIEEKLAGNCEEKLNYKLQNLIFKKELKAVFAWPQVYYKLEPEFLNVCREEKEYFINPNIREFSFYWFILTLFISIIFVYYILDKIPKDRFFYIKETEEN